MTVELNSVQNDRYEAQHGRQNGRGLLHEAGTIRLGPRRASEDDFDPHSEDARIPNESGGSWSSPDQAPDPKMLSRGGLTSLLFPSCSVPQGRKFKTNLPARMPAGCLALIAGTVLPQRVVRRGFFKQPPSPSQATIVIATPQSRPWKQ